MPLDAWIVLAVLVVAFGALVRGLATPAAVMVGSLVLLVVAGVVGPEQAFVGFASPATVTIAGLFVLARTIRNHLGLDRLLADLLRGDGHEVRPVLRRLLPPVALVSGFVNNTPIVATLAPVLHGWAERRGIASSRLLIPLSFATILGGTLTTIGTSTNLVVSGALQAAGREPLGFLTLTAVAAPIAVVGLVVVVLLAPRALPDRRPVPVTTPLALTTVASQRGVPVPVPDVSSVTGRPVGSTGARTPGPVDPGRSVADTPGQRGYRTLTLCTGTAMVVLAASGVVPVVTAVLLACGVLIAARAISFGQAVDALDLDVLFVVASAIGLGAAVDSSGLAAVIGRWLAETAGSRGSLFGLALIVVGTLILTELITNVAAAALVLPIAIEVAARVGGDPRGFAVAVAIAASASFLTPVGYQTNTIVFGIGRYRFGDYWRLGLPLTLTVVVMCLLVIPNVWP